MFSVPLLRLSLCVTSLKALLFAADVLLACFRACYGVLRFVMENGAKGCEVIVSGKLRAQRAKSMKFKDGYMGVLGIKVKIMLDWDPTGKLGPKTPLPDNVVVIHMPKEGRCCGTPTKRGPKEVEEYGPPLVMGDKPLPMSMPVPV
uniref:Putative ribosomal protein S3 n=1 Tax=Helianthus annuus TaxID=4232 RepID=A0A251UXQ9_HELAN